MVKCSMLKMGCSNAQDVIPRSQQVSSTSTRSLYCGSCHQWLRRASSHPAFEVLLTNTCHPFVPFSLNRTACLLSVGLTDYEVRDINDEINKLIREKGHWETQIVALGGANYKRGIPTMEGEDGGSEVPGGRGYK